MKGYKVLNRKVIFSKGMIRLTDCKIKMSRGRVISRQILEHPGSVVIIPRTGKGRYLLIRQFRFAAKDWLWEFPAGGLDPDESYRQAASRELIEEVGFRPRRLKKIMDFFPSPGISGEVMHLFLAEDLVKDYAPGDEDEEIETREFSAHQIERMIRNGQIRDAKTIAGFYFLQTLS